MLALYALVSGRSSHVPRRGTRRGGVAAESSTTGPRRMWPVLLPMWSFIPDVSRLPYHTGILTHGSSRQTWGGTPAAAAAGGGGGSAAAAADSGVL